MEAAQLPWPTQLNLPAFPQLAFSYRHCKKVQQLLKLPYLCIAFTCCLAKPPKAQCCTRDIPHEQHEEACRKMQANQAGLGCCSPRSCCRSLHDQSAMCGAGSSMVWRQQKARQLQRDLGCPERLLATIILAILSFFQFLGGSRLHDASHKVFFSHPPPPSQGTRGVLLELMSSPT